ncbi:MAG TPA: hypothetical protein VMS77_09120 [Conexivisphaerales archaeon]|nr:hypothetical protein [Conexivisphaerales archaeon]
MANPNEHHIHIEVRDVACPRCKEGSMLPFLDLDFRKRNGQGGLPPNPEDFLGYKIHYECTNCGYRVEEDSLAHF